MAGNNVLNDEELSGVTGGWHLSSDETKSLRAGEILILEDTFGKNWAKVRYLGQYRDPGYFSVLELKVEIIDLYGHGAVNSSLYGQVHIGDVIWVQRTDADFPSRA